MKNVHKQQLTFSFWPDSCLLNAHCCLHCSHDCGAPHFFSEFVHRWHLLPINAAIILQYSQADGCKR